MADTPTLMNPDAEAARARGARIGRLATALLILMTVVFIVATLIERSTPWFGYVRATAEAAMIGALADWFAVTALFRHPLGLKIPHTAIVPNRKDQIGKALGTFVQTNFLTRDNIVERIQGTQPSLKLGAWLEQPGNAAQVGRQATEGLTAIVASLDDAELSQALRDVVVERLRSIDVAPLAARALAGATKEGRHQDLVDTLLPFLGDALVKNQDALLHAIASSSPWWVPRSIDEAVMIKSVEVFQRFLGEVGADRNHPFRAHIDTVTADLVDRLANDPEMVQRADELRNELLANPAVQTYLDGLWDGTKQSILEQSDDPASALTVRIEGAISEFGRSLRSEPDMRRKVDAWLERIAAEVVERFEGEIGSLVTSTVDRWDATETSDQLESLIGPDLQYIRISGTVVGGLAGLVIYTVAQLIK